MEENERTSFSKKSSVEKPSFVLDDSLENQLYASATTKHRLTNSVERPLLLQRPEEALRSRKLNSSNLTETKETSESTSAEFIENNKKTSSVSGNQAAPTFSFVSWRTSAGFVIDSIREKLGYFRRAPITEEVGRPDVKLTSFFVKGNRFSSNSVTKDILNRSEEIVKQANEPECSHEEIREDRIPSRMDERSVERDELSSLYDNDSVSKLFENDEDLEARRSPTNHEENDASVDNSDSVTSPLCSPCIGSKNHLKDDPPQDQSVLKSTSSLRSEVEDVKSNQRIVHHQPCNNQDIQTAASVQAVNSVSFLERQTENDGTVDCVSDQVTNIPLVKLQTASTHDSINQDLNLNCCPSENESMKCNRNSKSTASMDSLDIADDPAESLKSEIVESKGFDKNEELLANQQSFNIWDLRNTLENVKIEIQCPKTGFEDFEMGRRLSVATDCMTEVSPLSTPSSEHTNFRGKSISDSEEEGVSYVVTPSGRLSPRPVNASSQKNSSEMGLNRNSNLSSARNLSDPGGLNSRINQKNSFVTTATIECTSRASFPAENSGSDDIARTTNGCSRTKPVSVCTERRKKMLSSQKRSTSIENEAGVSTSSFQLLRQSSLPLPMGSRSKLAQDVIVEDPEQTFTMTAWNDVIIDEEAIQPQSVTSFISRSDVKTKDFNQSSRHCRRSSSNSFLSDDVFLADSSTNARPEFFPQGKLPLSRASTKRDPSPNKETSNCYGARTDVTFVPPTQKSSQRPKFRTKLGSTASSGTSSPTSPVGSSSGRRSLIRQSKSVDLESDSSISSSTPGSRSSSNLRNLAKFFRRPNRNRRRCDSAPTFCGYSMDRDYCVDPQTDRIFKEFLCQTTSTNPVASLPSGESLPPPSHMMPPPPLKQTSSAQLRRQVMRKQYSDSIAMYYGQRQRKWRFSKQKSDSINYPVGRGTFRRQERIDEEFDPEEINERLSSTSSRLDSEKSEYKPPTVNELKQWRQSSEDRNRSLRHATSLPAADPPTKPDSAKTGRRVTFQPDQFGDIGTHLRKES